MTRQEYFHRKFAHAGHALARTDVGSGLSVKFRGAFFCVCDTCGWGPTLAELRAKSAELQRRDVDISVEPHETGIEIIAFGAAGSLVAAAVIQLAKLILTRWNRPRDPRGHRDIQIEVRKFRSDGRLTEEHIALVRYPAQEKEIEEALKILERFLTDTYEVEGADDAQEG